MPDYKKMYYQLFNSVSDAVRILQEGQQKGEEYYLSQMAQDQFQANNQEPAE